MRPQRERAERCIAKRIKSSLGCGSSEPPSNVEDSVKLPLNEGSHLRRRRVAHISCVRYPW